MKTFKLAFLLFSLILSVRVTRHTHAQNRASSTWVRIASSKQEYVLYNPRRVERTPKGTTKIWLKELPKVPSKKEGFKLLLMECDCVEAQFRLLSQNKYSADGELLVDQSYGDYEGAWNHVLPDSIGESVMEVACSEDQDQPARPSSSGSRTTPLRVPIDKNKIY